ncbi:glycosyltransferase [Halobellus clavatus]|nr:glycosyltransferase [Halobellus clavatus]
MKTAVVHDGTIHPGGAVRVVIEAARALDADLFVGFSGMDREWWSRRVPNNVKILRSTSRDSTFNSIRTALSMLKLDIREYDCVLTSGPATKFFQPYDDQLRIHYLHHPPLSSLWFTGGLFDYTVKTIDRVETLSIPHILANSELTSTRAFRHYNREVDRILSPPVDVEKYSTDSNRVEGQVVMVGRLEDRKRTTLAVEAMRHIPDYTLKLIGDGPLRKKVERDSPSNVDILGYVDDDTLRCTVQKSVAGIFLAEREDFGITPIEYLAAGTPVVGVDEPNTNNQISRETGVLVDPEPSAVANGIRDAIEQDWNRSRLRKTAEQFGAERFRTELQEFVEVAYI